MNWCRKCNKNFQYVILGCKITLVSDLSHKPRDTCAVKCTLQVTCFGKDCVGTYMCSLQHVLSVSQLSHCNGNLVSDISCSLFVVFLYRTTKSVWREIYAMLIALLDNLLYSWIAWHSKCYSSAASNVSTSLVLTLLRIVMATLLLLMKNNLPLSVVNEKCGMTTFYVLCCNKSLPGCKIILELLQLT
jgi:hypothetical protein